MSDESAASGLQAITLDAGGTLIHPYPSPGAVYARILEKHQPAPPVPDLDRRFVEAFHHAQSSPEVTGRTYDRDYWRWIVHRTLEAWVKDSTVREDVFEKAYEEFGHASAWRISAGLHAFLETCRDAGLRLAVFSNNDGRLWQVLDEFGLTPFFEEIFVSAELGFDKPHPRAFQAVQSRLVLPPRAILHIGDSLRADYNGAINAGWQALLLADPPPRPDVCTARNWQEAADVIRI